MNATGRLVFVAALRLGRFLSSFGLVWLWPSDRPAFFGFCFVCGLAGVTGHRTARVPRPLPPIGCLSALRLHVSRFVGPVRLLLDL